METSEGKPEKASIIGSGKRVFFSDNLSLTEGATSFKLDFLPVKSVVYFFRMLNEHNQYFIYERSSVTL